jgi:hypothetical protein
MVARSQAGVDDRAHNLIARDNTVRPQPDRICTLKPGSREDSSRVRIDVLISGSRPLDAILSSPDRRVDGCARSVLYVDTMGRESKATNPLRTVTESVSNGDTRFAQRLMIEVSDEFINTHTDPYAGNARQVEPICNCGRNLEYEGTASWLAT